MNNKFGSIWNKWDFHVHTPYSILNNNYGFNPFEMEKECDIEKAFDVYVQKLFMNAIENRIAAIGITDYFMIEGYKRIVNNYLRNPEKMAELFPDKDMRKKVEEIYVFPNIEIRIDSFVGEKANAVNYHVIFSDTVSIQALEENFLHQLMFQGSSGAKIPLTIQNIINMGKQIKEHKDASGSDLLVGLNHVTVNYNDVLRVLRNSDFKGKYLITIPVDEDLSKVSWSGRDYITRKILYQQCDCYMTSNARTAAWAIADGEEEERIREFGSLKPCIWGSDAHEYERMFNPANDKHCWIKAEPSFEGLIQIKYEPKERVVIQKEHPGEKDIHQIIESIQFEDENFQTEPIVFNDNLTCIIGGKSTGKSLLLQQLAKTIDGPYAEAQEKVSDIKRKKFPMKKATVTWKDGTTNGRKIVYIPQTFLNRTIDNPEESTAINNIIANVLLQEPDIKNAYALLEDTVRGVQRRVQLAIYEYCETLKSLRKVEDSIKQKGTPESFELVIKQLETEQSILVNSTNIKQEDIERYAELEQLIRSLEIQLEEYRNELFNLMNMSVPKVIVPEYFLGTDNENGLHDFKAIFPHVGEKLQNIIESLNINIQFEWQSGHDTLIVEINKILENIEVQIETNKKEYNHLKTMVEQNEHLQKLSWRISMEKRRLDEAKALQKTKQKYIAKIKELKNNIIGSQQQFLKAYTEYCNSVVTTGTNKSTALTFDVRAVIRLNDFKSMLGNIFNNRSFASYKNTYQYDLNVIDQSDYGEHFLETLWTAMMDNQKAGGLLLKGAYSMESALQQIFGNWYNIHYIVKSGNDTIEDMSPGKKALVLLELLISLEDSKCPILIDQPEDDLDNRSIYYDLVQYIKQKKKERQIIIVTHNANVVLCADAEEIIIANQEGKGTENASKRFEYRSGAIENDEIMKDEQGHILPGILNRSGIQTQICDILEGGHPAFEHRKNKYMTISQ